MKNWKVFKEVAMALFETLPQNLPEASKEK
jgi:hypothetical protein